MVRKIPSKKWLLRYSSIMLLLCFIITTSKAKTPSPYFPYWQEDVIINLEKSEGSIFEIFTEIESKTDFTFAYDKDKLKGVENVKLKQGKQSLNNILDRLSQTYDLEFKEINQVIHVKQSQKK